MAGGPAICRDEEHRWKLPKRVAGVRRDLVRGGSMMIRQVFSSKSERWGAALTLLLAAALVVALSPSPAWCQATAAVNGTVRDSAGGGGNQANGGTHKPAQKLERPAAPK